MTLLIGFLIIRTAWEVGVFGISSALACAHFPVSGLRAQNFAPCRRGSPASAFSQEQSSGAGVPCSLSLALVPNSETQLASNSCSPLPPTSLGSSLVLPRLSPCLGHGHTHQPRPRPAHLL